MYRVALALSILFGEAYAQSKPKPKPAAPEPPPPTQTQETCTDKIDKDSQLVFTRAEPTGNGYIRCYVKHKDGSAESLLTVISEPSVIPPKRFPKGRCARYAAHPTCAMTKKPPKDQRSPPGEEISARCTQLPEIGLLDKSVVDLASANNIALVAKTDGWKDLRKKYKEAMVEVDEKLDFAVFTEKQMCKGYPVTDVNIGIPCGTYERDFAAANNMIGLGDTPDNCTWHHHEDLGRMQLVEQAAHKGTSHSGGLAVWRQVFGYKDYPLCCPSDADLAEPTTPEK